jgi:hypothetical protein
VEACIASEGLGPGLAHSAFCGSGPVRMPAWTQGGGDRLHLLIVGGGLLQGFLSSLGLGISSGDTKSAHTGRFIRDGKVCS